MLETNPSTTITRNAGWLMLGSTISKVFFFAGGVITARYLGTAGYGVYAFATFFSFIFATLADGGLEIILVREVSRDKRRANRYFGTVLLLKCGITLLALVLLSVTVLVMGLSATQVRAVYLAMAAFLALSYGNTAVAICRAFERMALEGVVAALQGLVFLILVIISVTTQGDVLQLIGALLVAYVLSALLAYYWVITRFSRPKLLLESQLGCSLLKEAWPIGLSLFLLVLYGRIGTVALEAMQGSVEAGTYSAAFGLVHNLSFVPIALTTAYLPAFSQSALSRPHRFSTLYATAFKVMLLTSVPLAIGGMFLSEPVVDLVYGHEFGDATVALRIVAWTVVFSFLSWVSKTALETTNRQARWTWALAMGVGANLLVNLFLIPHSGMIGASLALLVADVLIFVASLYFVLREMPWLTAVLSKLGGMTLISATLMGLTFQILQKQHAVLATLSATLVYLLSLTVLRVVDKEDLGVLKKAFMAERNTSNRAGEADGQ